jgi:hypothetical protein
MRLIKTIRLIRTFYSNFFLVSVLITSCCLVLFWEYGISIFAALFWLKITTLAITFWFINSYRSKEYYYYQNLGISKVLLWTTTLIFDFALFIFLIVQMYKFK